GLVRGAGPGAPDKVVFVGMEVVRRDWTGLSKIYQRGLFERLFRGASGDEVLSYTRDFVRELKEGGHDAQLVYRKALRKGIERDRRPTPRPWRAGGLVEAPWRGWSSTS